MRNTLRPTLLATVAALGLGSLGAMAAPPAPAATAPATDQAMPATHASVTATPPRNMTERVNHRIAELHGALRITPVQAPQWNHFSAVMRENAHDMDQAMRRRMDRLPTMNAEQNMRSYMHVAAAHARSMRKLLPAFEHLYNTMSPGQKAAADRVFRNDAYRGKPGTARLGAHR